MTYRKVQNGQKSEEIFSARTDVWKCFQMKQQQKLLWSEKNIFKKCEPSTYSLHYFFLLLTVCWKNIHNGNVHNAAFYLNDMTRTES